MESQNNSKSIAGNLDPSNEHSTSSKFKKVFQKKKSESVKENLESSSSRSRESLSSSIKKSQYKAKLQKLRRKVRKTYHVLEAQETNTQASTASGRYASSVKIESVSEEFCGGESPSQEVVSGSRNSRSPSSDSSDSEVSLEEDEDTDGEDRVDRVSCSYEASNSLPSPEAVESSGSISSESESNEVRIVSEAPEVPEHLECCYIDMNELFERPQIDGLALARHHLAPCLSPIVNEKGEEVKKKATMHKQAAKSDQLEQTTFYYSDSFFAVQMQDSIRELALDGHFTDVTIEVEGQKIRCHRMVLAATSKYFKAMFCNNYRERDQPLVKIEAVSAEVMKILIRYSYTSYLEISSDNVQNVLEAASLLQYHRVMEACSNYFAGELAIENAPGIMELAQRHNLMPLLALARLKCVTCFEELREKSDYQRLSTCLFESLICRNDLMVYEEEEVFRAVMEWCQYDEENRKKNLHQLLRHVKFPLLQNKFFVREVETHPLIRNNPELYDLLMETRLFHVAGVTPKCERLVPRHNSSMHQVFVTVGGCNKNDHFVNEITVLDYQQKTRATLCQLPNSKNSVRHHKTEGEDKSVKWAEFGCIAWKGNIVISGGKDTQTEAWMFITDLRQWVELASLNTGRWRHRMVVCEGELYAVGGYDGVLRVDSLEKYNERENCWVEKRTMREGVSSAAVCECNGKIYVIGGGPSVKVSTDKVQVYNPLSNTWCSSVSMPEPAKCINAVSLANTVYVAGGTLGLIYTFHTRTKIWDTLGKEVVCERASCGLTVCNDLIFIVGGRDDEGKVITNVSYVDPKAKVLRSECNLAFGISHHGCLTLQKFDPTKTKPSESSSA